MIIIRKNFPSQEKNFISSRPSGLAENSCKSEKWVEQRAVILNLAFEVLGGNSMFFQEIIQISPVFSG